MGIADAAEALEVEMSRGIVVVLKAIVAVIVAAILVSQVWLIPLMANSAAEDLPEYAWMELPLLVLVEVALVCVQVFLVCVWVLAGRVVRGSIFEESSLTWVSVLAAMPVGVALASLAAFFYIPGPPLLGLTVLLVVLICIGLSLLLVVMRTLLVQASADHADLQGVI